jgi:hypothetical protein
MKKYNKKSLGGNIKEYSAFWEKNVSKELFGHVYYFYSHVDFEFLVDKVERELNKGNAGGPQVRSRFNEYISSRELAVASIHGLKILLTIKTFENVFPFTEKTRITDDSMLTDLAWHSFMLKPHKYYLITNTIMNIIFKYTNKKFYSTFNIKKEIEKAVEMINKEVVLPVVIQNDEEESRNKYVSFFETMLNKDKKLDTPVLVRHGTDKEIKIDIDIRDFIKKIIDDKTYDIEDANMQGFEWNMPLPLFEKFPYANKKRTKSKRSVKSRSTKTRGTRHKSV